MKSPFCKGRTRVPADPLGRGRVPQVAQSKYPPAVGYLTDGRDGQERGCAGFAPYSGSTIAGAPRPAETLDKMASPYCTLRKLMFSPSSRYSAEQVAAADHRLTAAELAARDEPQRSASRARHDGNEGVLRMTQFGLVFQDKNRSRVHFLGNPFFQKLQIG